MKKNQIELLKFKYNQQNTNPMVVRLNTAKQKIAFYNSLKD